MVMGQYLELFLDVLRKLLAAETIAAVAAAEAMALFSGGLPPLMTVSRQPVAVTERLHCS